jgi:hypothetical protein
MMFNKKCPVCGARNSKERMTCVECDRPLNIERIEQRPSMSPAVTQTPKPRIREEEYFEREKILFKTGGQAGYDAYSLQKAVIIIIEENLIIESKEHFKIPFSRIEGIDPDPQSTYSALVEKGLTINFLDKENKKQRLLIFTENHSHIDLQKAIYRQIIGKYFKPESARSGGKSTGSFFLKVSETFRDKTRDDFCSKLKTMGINAQLAARGRFEEGIIDMDLDPGGYSLGIIGLEESPIKWINIRKESGSKGQDYPVYHIDYGIVDMKLRPDSPYRTYHFFNSRWQGRDSGSGILDRLNNDPGLKESFLEGIRIAAITDYGCWIISKKMVSTEWKSTIPLAEPMTELTAVERAPQNSNFVPSNIEWKCYQTIAQYLTADSPK